MSDIGPGDVVVCVDDAGRPGLLASVPVPPAGKRFVVESVGVLCGCHPFGGQPTIEVAGYPNVPCRCRAQQQGWLLSRFRKANGGDHDQSLLKVLEVHPSGTVDA